MLAIIASYSFSTLDDAIGFCRLVAPLIDVCRSEKGCQLYGFSRDIRNEKTIWVSEQWDSQEDLDEHLKAAHIKKLLLDMAELSVESNDVRQFEVTSVGPVVFPED